MTERRNKGDRKDGYRVVTRDPMQTFMPFIMGTRTDNECVMNTTFDMTNVVEYLAKKNAEHPEFKYTLFHFSIAAMAKTMKLRPKLNYFFAGNRLYEHKTISFCFTAKHKFADEAAEFVMQLTAEDDGNSLIDQVHDKICSEVYKTRKHEDETGEGNSTDKMMVLFNKIPRPVLKLVIKLLNWLDYHDWLPKAIRDVDPYRSSVFISNLGSIDLEATYHHLINWSLCSVFVLANRMHKMPFFNEDGTYEMKDGMSYGFTIDERIADGFYCAKSLKVFEQIVKHPECLDDTLSAPLDKYLDEGVKFL